MLSNMRPARPGVKASQAAALIKMTQYQIATFELPPHCSGSALGAGC